MATRKTAPRSAAAKAPARKAPARKAAAPAEAKTKPAKATQAAAAPKADKPHKLVRDSFTIPKNEYAALADLKQRAARLARPAKKSELLRAGIKALGGMADAAFLAALKGVPSLKTGRPKEAEAEKA